MKKILAILILLAAPAGIPQAKSYNDAINELTTEFRKGMEN